MAAKVIRTFKKFSSRKLDVNPTDSPRSPKTEREESDKDSPVRPVRTGTPKKIKELKIKDSGRSSEGKGKSRSTNGSSEKVGPRLIRPTQQEPAHEKRRRRVRRNGNQETEDKVGRENDDGSESLGLMEQAEYVTDGPVEEINDYVGCYDFGNLSLEGEEAPTAGFSCLSPEEIVQTRKKQIQEIAELLVISASNASNLLYHYQWKTEVLHQRYWDSPEDVMREAGLVCAAPDADDEAKLSGDGECLVCCETVEGDECCALRCRHRFCRDCWSSYLTVKIKEGEVTRINCPALNCKYTVPDPVVQKLVDKELYEKYLRFVTKSFVEDNAQITWCPAPRCGNAITTDMVHGRIVLCRCGFRFCFSCHHEAHVPASCEQVKMWGKKCSDDSETGHWLGANTKDCPRCGVFVEKNGGCNHMTCRQCANEWCWLCLKQWKGHSDYYACTRYEKAQKKKAEKQNKDQKKKTKKQSKLEQQEAEREAKRIALERYLSYYTKYLDYDAKVKTAPTIRERAQTKIQTLQSEQSTLAEVRFIETATETLLECHEVLKYSFVCSYYLPEESPEKHIFVFLQEELEKTAEVLSEMLESAGLLRRRTECVDLGKLAQTKKESLLRAVEHGLEGNTEVYGEYGEGSL